MKKMSPVCANTVVSSDPHEWTPKNFDDFIRELNHIIDSCPGNNPLFRGHADRKWLLESTFVRTCKKILLNIESHIRPSNEIRESCEYQQSLFSLLLLKYDVLGKPSVELKNLESEKGIDALFEFIKRCQQYPEEDKILKGTFFVDWSKDKNVGLYFANFDASENSIKFRRSEGALFICDMTATGKTLVRKNVEEIINLMLKANNENKLFRRPLLFYPPRQIYNLRANRQEVAYWAQMDLRYDLEDIWKLQEKDKKEDEYIFIKLILPDGTQDECEDYLNDQSPAITHHYLFPKEQIDFCGKG